MQISSTFRRIEKYTFFNEFSDIRFEKEKNISIMSYEFSILLNHEAIYVKIEKIAGIDGVINNEARLSDQKKEIHL